MPVVTGYLAFMPLYVAGLLGMTRRLQHYNVPSWHPWILAAAAGALVIAAGIACQVAQLVVSIRRRESLKDITGDPWNGRTLEWATPSPPPLFNFAFVPHIEGEGAYWQAKQRAIDNAQLRDEPMYEAIEMPRNTATGVVCAFFATIAGFALIWHIWWLVGLAFVGAWGTFVAFAWRDRHEEVIPAETVARLDRANRLARTQRLPELRAAT